jgi:hypothetical protein
MFAKINAVALANKKMIVNALGFQVVWFMCVQGNNLNASLAAIGLLCLHNLIFKIELKAWPILIAFSVIGYFGDSVIAKNFHLIYSDNLDPLAPLWLLSLWLAFSTTLNHSMQWLFNSKYLTLFIALFIVPISYFAGIQLSGSTFSLPINSTLPYWAFYIAEGTWWAILLLGYKKLTSAYEITEVQHV